jgi:membrane protease YdiL (CAAX protease family)
MSWLALIPRTLGLFPVPLFAFGPLLAALVVAAVCGGRRGTMDLLARMVQWRAAPRWYAYALLLPVAVALGAAVINVSVFGAPDPTNAILAALPSAAPGFLLLLLSPLSGSMGEEPGWRGFALPRLLSLRSPLVASLVLGVLAAG